ncbi:MAG: response regulator, partial [Pseudomonadota bacterium]
MLKRRNSSPVRLERSLMIPGNSIWARCRIHWRNCFRQSCLSLPRTNRQSCCEEAWQAFQEKTYPLLVLDWMLPGMSGLDLCRQIRNSP